MVPYIEKNLRTPEGSFTNARWVDRSTFITFAEVPAERAYWAPFPGHSSTFDSLRKRGAKYISDRKDFECTRGVDKRVRLKDRMENTFVASRAGR